MQKRSLTVPLATAPCCSDDVEGATCGIEEGNHQCACAESKPVPVSPRLLLSDDNDQTATASNADEHTMNIRSGLLFVVACLTSPCCTPLLVPLVAGLLAGTPLAIWLTPHLAWIYTALTVVFVSSLIFAFFSLRQRPGRLSGLFKRV